MSLLDTAHEIWAAAQLLPAEGIVDGVGRVESLLSQYRKEALLEAGFSHLGEGRSAKRKEVRDAIYAECLAIVEKYGMKDDVIYKEISRRMAESDKTTVEGEKE